MVYEKEIKREDGTRYRIAINLHLDSYRSETMTYRVDLDYKEKGKRKWLDVPLGLGEWKFRELSMEDREQYRNTNMLRFVTNEEIYRAKVEAWKMLRPKI